MARESLRDLLEFAVEVAWRAGRVTLAHFQTGIAAETKPDATPVTLADRQAERLARDLIEARFPADGVLGEEFGELREGARRRWILDPIDGTRSFVRGVPLYGVLLALEEGDDAVLGVAHFPARVSPTADIGDAVALTSDVEHIGAAGLDPVWDRLRHRVGYTRTWGDCYGHALVATGRAEIMFDPVLAPWDAAALLPILHEAGGVFTDLAGNTTHRGGNGISTNAALADLVRDILRGKG
jgi:histidinol-phosphatase